MVIKLKGVVAILGVLLLFLGIALVAPSIVGLIYGEAEWIWFAVVAVGSAVVGGLCWRFLHDPDSEIGVREGFLIVALAWVVLSLVGSLPFILTGVLPSFANAFFETMSGFTTTGATILGGTDTPPIEALPQCALFWRSFTQWLGGMGIIVLTLAILPILGVGGMQMFKAETPGPTADKLTPRVRETAKRLWIIYVGFTVVQVLLLLPVMDLFNAINHAFTTMATGGFSTKNNSIADFGSAYTEWVIIVFMILGGISFTLHYRLLKGDGLQLFRNTELRVYLSILLAASVILSLAIWNPIATTNSLSYESLGDAIRLGTFQAAAIMTTTGYSIADYLLWAPLAIGVLFVLYFMGGMAGSTSGGFKVVRHTLLFKNSFKEIKQLVHPNAVIPVRLDGKVVSPDIMRNVLSFAVLYFALVIGGALVMTMFNMDMFTALGASMSAVGNVGPAFGSLGPAGTFAELSGAAKWILSMLMMAGRLELFTLLIIFAPAFWRR